jgi:PAS domain S-box-containing protein
MISILLVDDEPDLLDIARISLEEQRGFRIECATSAKAALRRIPETPFDVIVSDYQMPEMNGIEFLKKLRGKKNYIPFIIFTGRGREEIAIEALNAGADFYLQKGGDPIAQFAELSHIIRKVVRQHRAEKALEESDERYRRIIDGLTDYLYTVRVRDGKAIATTHSAACFVLTGYTAEEFAADPYLWIRMIFPEDQNRVISHFSGVLSGNHVPPVEHRIVRKDGQVRWVRDTPVLHLDATGMLVSYDGVIKDITVHKVAEDVLRQSEEKYRQLVDLAQEGIWAINAEGTTSYVNPRMAEMLGYTVEEMHGRHLFSFMDDAGKTIAAENMERRRQGIKEDHDFEFITKEGNRIYTALATVPITDDDGAYKGALAVVSDITERKRAENALIRVNQKLNVLSQLTRKDLTSQIFVLNSYLEITKKQLAGQNHIIETVQKGVRSIQSIQETIEYSKDYQDMGAKPPKWQNVNMVLLFGLSHISIGNIQHSLETENLEVFADPLLEKVCQRLLENSVKHGEHVTRIRVSHTITPEGATIFFEDDGIGIPQENKEQIFLRDNSTGRASMRSLIFVREILDITGISITETGEPGKGTRFEMMVPKGAWRIAGKGA